MHTAYYKSPIGILIIEADGTNITSILFANSQKGKVIDENAINFSVPESSPLKKCILQLDEYFAGTRRSFDLNISQQGTSFQQNVWKELLNIPYGKVISYLDLSKRVGNTKAIRAVGQTNGNNKICILVPCHRVIGSDGKLTGYGGDLWRKKWLLDHEASFEHGVRKLF